MGRAAALPAVLRSRALASLYTGLCQRRHQLLLPNGCASDPAQQVIQPRCATGPRVWRAASGVTCLVLQAYVRQSRWHVSVHADQSAGQRLSKLPGSWCGYQGIWLMMPWQPSLGSCWPWSEHWMSITLPSLARQPTHKCQEPYPERYPKADSFTCVWSQLQIEEDILQLLHALVMLVMYLCKQDALPHASEQIITYVKMSSGMAAGHIIAQLPGGGLAAAGDFSGR